MTGRVLNASGIDSQPACILLPSTSMDTRHGTQSRKSKFSLLASRALGVPRSRAHSVKPRHHQSASTQSNRSNQEQETERKLKQALSSEASLKAELARLETSLEESLANRSSLQRDYKKQLAHTEFIEMIYRQDVETLQASLTRSTSKRASLKR